MINVDFCNDPLTGLKNLFGLIDSDISSICGENGILIAIDIAKFDNVNKTHGREIGDICIKSLAKLILSGIYVRENISNNSSIFRVGGDEFTLILPYASREDAEALIEDIVYSFREEMLQHHNFLAGLHTSIIQYTEEIQSVSSLLKLTNSSLTKDNLPGALPKWADHLIDDIVLRTKETLSLLRQANKLALSDEVSGLPNHRSAEIHLAKYLQQYHNNHKPFSILFIDGDNLKQYNQLGYQRGNQLIKDLGKLISAPLRRDDHVFRWLSGDEFLVILSGAEREDALKLAERIRSHIEIGTLDFPFPVTVSIGVSSCPDDGVTIGELVSKAEAANSLAKRTGKNKVS